MKKLIILLFILTNSTFIFSQNLENIIEVVKQLEINETTKNSSFFILENKDSKYTLTSSEVVGIPLKNKKNIKIIISEQLKKTISKIEITDVNNNIYTIIDYATVKSSKFKWNEIRLYDNSNKLISKTTLDLLFQ